jgi:acetyl-CoA hydrolase
MASSKLLSRIGRPSLLEKVMPSRQAVEMFIKGGMTMGWTGFTPAGYPKEMPIAIADYVEEKGLDWQFELFVGASSGAESEDNWAKKGLLKRRWPYQTGKNIQKGINNGSIDMGDIHLGLFPQNLSYGFFTKDAETNPGKLDMGLIEVTEILPNGGLVLGTSVGAAPEVIDTAEKLILEVNTSIPSLKGLHDIVQPEYPPYRKPLLLTATNQRIGKPYVEVDQDKIVAIVESERPDNGRGLAPPDAVSETIAGHIIDFLVHERDAGRLPSPGLLPLQSGVGSIANAVVGGMTNAPFDKLNVWTEVLQDTVLDLFDTGKLECASSTSLSLSPDGFKRYFANREKYEPHIILRPQQISNNAELIRRLGVIAMNTPVELDMYGHANSTLVGGTMMINGLGGSGDFLRNAYISIMHTPSARKTKTDPTGISCIVPKCSHIDHTEHDLDVFVTEQGLADLRGLSPRNRALEIIRCCAHPDYKDQLLDYYHFALKTCLARGAGHEPQILSSVYKMHHNLSTKGSMKVDNWEPPSEWM